MDKKDILHWYIEELSDKYVKFYIDMQKYGVSINSFEIFLEFLFETLWQVLAYEWKSIWVYEKEQIIEKSFEIWIIQNKEIYIYFIDLQKNLFWQLTDDWNYYKDFIWKHHKNILEDIKFLKKKYIN